MVILDLWGISFHPAVVVGLGNDLIFNSILAHCDCDNPNLVIFEDSLNLSLNCYFSMFEKIDQQINDKFKNSIKDN